MFLTELTDLINRGYSVSFHPEYTSTYPAQRADPPIRCMIEKPEKYGCNGWGESLQEAFAKAEEELIDCAFLEVRYAAD